MQVDFSWIFREEGERRSRDFRYLGLSANATRQNITYRKVLRNLFAEAVETHSAKRDET